MRDYMIVTDATADLTPEILTETGVIVMPMEVTIGEDNFNHYPDAREMPYNDFYGRVRAGEPVKTAQIKLAAFYDFFEEILSGGKDILYLGFSSGLSGTYSTSVIIANELSEKYPDAKIYTVDTLSASMGEGLLVYYAALEKQKGKNIDEVREFAEETKLKLCHWFTVDDLNHLRRGGRLSAAVAFAGTLLGIKPILHFDEEGHLLPVAKSRGRRQSIEALFKRMEENGVDINGQVIFVAHGDCEQEMNILVDMIKAKYSVREIRVGYIGPVIGAHSGPGTIALFFLSENRAI